MAASPQPVGTTPTGGAPQGLATATQPEGSNLDQAFVADRAIFWGRFTGFVKLGIGAVLLVVLFLFFFVYL